MYTGKYASFIIYLVYTYTYLHVYQRVDYLQNKNLICITILLNVR